MTIMLRLVLTGVTCWTAEKMNSLRCLFIPSFHSHQMRIVNTRNMIMNMKENKKDILKYHQQVLKIPVIMLKDKLYLFN